ncbi:MAG: tetratricopeptide repeat protein [Planctomycetaceae bacterium]|nr:tetratricopeptide repeat protein [Planctomycetaceae bacterium]
MRFAAMFRPRLGHAFVLWAMLSGIATTHSFVMPRAAAEDAAADETGAEPAPAGDAEPAAAEAPANDVPATPGDESAPPADPESAASDTPDAAAAPAEPAAADPSAVATETEPDAPAVVVGDQRPTATATDAPQKNASPAGDVPTAADEPAPKIEAEAATFNGAQPGKTTRAELETLWGKPQEVDESDETTVQMQFAVAPFSQVTATLEQGVLTNILIQLEKGFPAAALAKELQLDDFMPAVVSDEFGELLGQAYPERGVIFTFAEGERDPVVSQIIIERIDAQPFVLRAERHARARYRANLADLDYALSLDPQCVRAHALRARILLEVGNFPEARQAIAAACEHDAENPEYRLLQAKIWEQQGDSEGALVETRAALGLAEKDPVWKAAALAQLGDQIAAGPDRDYKQAATYHQQAIRLAQAHLNDRRVAVRRAAHQVLLDAHLEMANDIAWGAWNNKATAVPQWLQRTEKLISDSPALQADVVNARFQLCQQALAACVGLQGKVDPRPWIDAAAQHGAKLIKTADDPLARQRIQWELGMAYYDALQVYHMRRQFPQALEYGGKAVTNLEAAVAQREPIPGQSYLMGRLYFRLGSILAAQKKDRTQAIPWFDKAVPLMEEPIPQTAMADIGRQGETFVSMAVSYWEASQPQEALRLTEQGLKLIEQAVEEEILERTALAIPYSNLADMHRQLGDEAKAKSFAEMAAQIQSQKRR